MLVLTRKHQEKIRIGDNITITILKTKGKAVRIGIEAPNDIAVVRGELAAKDAAASDNSAASETPAVATRRLLRNSPVTSSWKADSRPTAAESSRRRQPVMEVTLQRVSRKDAAAMLPRLPGETAPLRSLLSRRATA